MMHNQASSGQAIDFRPERRLAFVVGVDAAPRARTPALRQTLKSLNDAQRMAEVLTERCDFELVQPPLLGEQASTEQVKSALLQLAKERKADDFLLFYFSGHGHLIRGEEHEEAYLVTHNFTESEASADPDLHLSLRWLQRQLYYALSAGKVLLILDCCYAGEMGRAGPDPYLEELARYLREYFRAPSKASGSSARGLRLTLSATGHLQRGYDKGEHGLMTALLLDALEGRVDEVITAEDQSVHLQSIQVYLQRHMPRVQHTSLSGDDAGQTCILTYAQPSRPEVTKKLPQVPDIYLPFSHNPLFQTRPDELEERLVAQLDPEIARREGQSPLFGLVGLGGIGKTSLSIEIALRCLQRNLFPAGIFWMPASATDLDGWRQQLASLAANAHYLPPEDDRAQPADEAERAHHFCLYLAQHHDALLILDNVAQPEFIREVLPQLAGRELACTILYTSRNQVSLPGVTIHQVEQLTEENALQLLLAARQDTLRAVENGYMDSETEAAHNICRHVSYLPLALEHLRALLAQDSGMTLTYLYEELLRRGAFELIERLNQVFSMSWDALDDEREKELFKLVACFPEAVPIPLWLLGLACGLGEDTHIGPLGQTYRHLARASMLEVLSNEQVRLHTLLREFGGRLLTGSPGEKTALLLKVGQRLLAEFANANTLEKRVLGYGYWECLGQVRAARIFLRQLALPEAATLKHIEKWLDIESSELADRRWWPDTLPGLFYQRLYNRAREEHATIAGTPPATWLRIEEPSGAEDHALLRILPGHRDGIKSVAFSPDGRRALTGSHDQSACIWNSDNGQLLVTLSGHRGSIKSVAFSPDGQLVATGSDDTTARIWESQSGQLLHILQGHGERVNSVAFSQDGKRLLTGSTDRRALLWSCTTGEQLFQFNQHSAGIQCVAFATPEPWILAGGGNSARIWNHQSQEMVRTFDGGIIEGSSLTFSPSGHLLVVSGPNSTASLIDCVQGRVLAALSGHSGRVISAAVSADARFVLTGSEDNTARLWAAESGRQLLLLANHNGHVSAVAFSADGRRLLSGSSDKAARIWEYDSAILLAQAQSEGQVQRREQMQPSPSDQDMADIMRAEEGRTWVSRAAFSRTGRHLVTGNSHTSSVRVWDSLTRSVLFTLESHASGITSVAISPDEERILTGTRDGLMRIWSSSSQEPLLTWSNDYYPTSSAFSPDGTRVLTNMDTQAALYDAGNGHRLFTLNGHTDKVKSVAFSPDGAWLLTGSNDRTARIWESATGTPLFTLREHAAAVMCTLFTHDGRQVLTVDRTHTLRIWRSHDGVLLHTVALNTDVVHTLSLSPDGTLITACDTNGRVLLVKGQEPGLGRPVALYVAPYEIRAVYWLDATSLLLVDRERNDARLHFYRLKLENMKTP